MAVNERPPLPSVEGPEEPTDGRSPRKWETTEDPAVRVVAILRPDGGPLRARDILTILHETGTSFISENPVYSVVGPLNGPRRAATTVRVFGLATRSCHTVADSRRASPVALA